MHFVQAKSLLLPGDFGGNQGAFRMNLYRGCAHGCIYCDSRATIYNMQHPFEDIEVKENALELLEDQLKRKRHKGMIGTGSMTDPYIPQETQLQYVRRSLELIEKYGYGFSCITKSTRILRDIDLLESINNKTKCVVQMTLTTSDEQLCKILEPHVSGTHERYLALKEFQKRNIPTVVWLCPLLPFITDTEENLRNILDLCIDAGVKGIICFNIGMTLREGNREYFYKKLDEHFPGMKEKYIYNFGNSYNLISPNSPKLMSMFHEICRAHGIMDNTNEIFRYIATFEQKNKSEQLSLF